MTTAAESVMPLLNSLSKPDRLAIAARLKRSLRSDARMTASERAILKRCLALPKKQRRYVADVLSIFDHPPEDDAVRLLQTIFSLSNGARLEIGWQLDESLPKRKLAPLSRKQIAELKRRMKEIDSGKAKAITWEKVKKNLEALSAKYRAKADAEVAASRIDWSEIPKPDHVAGDAVLARIRDAFRAKPKRKAGNR